MIKYTLKESTTPAVAGQPKRYGVVKLTQDVHAHFYVSCVQEEGQQPKAPRKRDPQTHLQWVAQLVAQSEKVYSCYEAGPTGFALHRQLTALGVENLVIAPVRLDEQGKKVNNDQTDTLQLAGRLDRYVAGNKRIFTVVRVPSLEEEQRRAWPRQRQQLQGQRLSLASQGRSLVLTQGVSIDNLWWQPARWKKHQTELAPWLLAHLEIYRKIILALDDQIQQIDQKILKERPAQAQPQPKYAGDRSLEAIEAEVCDWDRFGSWRKAGSYCGLTGGVSASGQAHADLSITKVGHRRLRTALIEMAWRLALHQPHYWLSKKWAHVLSPAARAHRRLRKKAIVAYARQLFVDLWKWKTGRITAEALGWEMS
jgi:transposase